MNKETGGPAFPQNTKIVAPAGQELHHGFMGGMTLRDYFAAKAMPFAYKFWMEDYYHKKRNDADIRNEEERDDLCDNYELIAESCYEMADAMLKAREN